MKAFETFTFSPEACRADLAALRLLLDSKAELSERADILPFFAEHRHLAGFVGSLNPNLHAGSGRSKTSRRATTTATGSGAASCDSLRCW